MQIKNILIPVFSLFLTTATYASPWYSFELRNNTNLTFNLKKVGQRCVHNGKYSVPKSIGPHQTISIKYDQDSKGGNCDYNSRLNVKINPVNGKELCVLELKHYKEYHPRPHPDIVALQDSKDYLEVKLASCSVSSYLVSVMQNQSAHPITTLLTNNS